MWKGLVIWVGREHSNPVPSVPRFGELWFPFLFTCALRLPSYLDMPSRELRGTVPHCRYQSKL